MAFVPKAKIGRAIFASGCFWGTEYYLARAHGVLLTTTGYTGGELEKPTYGQVHTGETGHAEAVEVFFNEDATSYELLARLFFETHDPTQLNRQGPDHGEQYRSEIFYLNEEQQKVATGLVAILKEKGLRVVTRITRAAVFWPAEIVHQDYYLNHGSKPYCHVHEPRF